MTKPNFTPEQQGWRQLRPGIYIADGEFAPEYLEWCEQNPPFLHHTLQPLDEVEFKDKETEIDMFNNECEGMCGI